MIKEFIYVVLLDYADENVGESNIEIIGTYRSMESARLRLKKWRDELLSGSSWEVDAIEECKKNGLDSGYDYSEDACHFEICENFRYDSNHTYCRILTQTLED